MNRLRTWWESRAESRADYTNLRIAEALERVSGARGVKGTDSYQGALNAIESAASVAELEGEFADVLHPHLGRVARALTDCGESTFELQVDGSGRLLLLPASIAAVTGTAAPDGWRYTLIRHGPTESTSIEREAAAVLSFRLHSNPASPWRGRPALAADSSGGLLAYLESQLADEAKIRVARVVSGGITGTQRKEISTAIGAGGIVAISGAKLGAKDQAAALHAGAIGAGFSQPSVELHEGLSRLVAGALGYPANLLLADGDGAAARESFRRMAAQTLGGILAAVKTEWEAKIGPLEISTDKLRASDETARARSFGSRANAVSRLVDSGLSLSEALGMAGFE